MTWLGTNTGKRIDLLNPDPGQICLEDIAMGLYHVPRFMGQTRSHYSVAAHSASVASLVHDEYKLAALLHDATEAYIGDVPTPLKDMLGDRYRDIERALSQAIAKAFNCPHDLCNLPEAIKKADRVMLVTEHLLLQENPSDWVWDKEELRLSMLPVAVIHPERFKEQVLKAMQYHK